MTLNMPSPISPAVSLELVEEIVEAVSPDLEDAIADDEEPADAEAPCNSVSPDGSQQYVANQPSDYGKWRSNQRERWRHNNVNDAFTKLSTLLPVFPITKKLKKKEILDRSIKYIAFLRSVLTALDDTPTNNHHKRRKSNPASDTPDAFAGAMQLDTHPITLMQSAPSGGYNNHLQVSSTTPSSSVSDGGSSSSESDDASSNDYDHDDGLDSGYQSNSPIARPLLALIPSPMTINHTADVDVITQLQQPCPVPTPPASPPSRDAADDWIADMMDIGYYY
ncbi:hypothetical protein BV898_05113 [Hypsibius exemplaris]|uniref:BHLH domain-containing protein n=1 Tax=Hypsibius exemplaris TaxID=2072580 RepID=A0A1W0X0Q9_HYPEX|nr:hypothetical protein BV898_05113 [Hypsibius exemplaris]